MADPQQNSDDTLKTEMNNKSQLPPPPHLVIMNVEDTNDDNPKQEINDNSNNKNSNINDDNNKNNDEIKLTNSKILRRSIFEPPKLKLNNNFNNNSTNNNNFTTTLFNNKTPFTLNPSRLDSVTNKSLFSTNNSKLNNQNVINGEIPKFVPLIGNKTEVGSTCSTTTTTVTTAATSTTTSATSTTVAAKKTTTTFVFGQNLQDRVLNKETKSNDEPKPSTSLNISNSNGTTTTTDDEVMLFSSAIKSDVTTTTTTDNNTNSNTNNNVNNSNNNKSLSDTAREYEESRANNKRKYEQVEIITGEEEEINILNMSCKLFSYDNKNNGGSWQERGRGTLRLNDFSNGSDDHLQSRLVFRTAGSLRVILNTKIWAEMTVERASEKSIRLTALDSNGEIKVFLIMTNIEDSKLLYTSLQSRLENVVATQKHKKCHHMTTTTTTTTEDSGGDN